MTIEIDAGSSASDTPSTHEEIERVKCKLGNALWNKTIACRPWNDCGSWRRKSFSKTPP